MSTTTSALHLHLPDENELAAESQANAADAAESELAEDAAASVEEGDEEEGGEDEEEEEQAAEETELADYDPEATLLEEPADEEATGDEAAGEEQPPTEAPAAAVEETAPGPQLAATLNRPLTPHQPPKSAALVAWEHRVMEAKDRYVGASLYRLHLDGALKTAKENEKKALEIVAEIENERPDGLEAAVEFSRPSPPAEAVAVVEEVGDSGGDSDSSTPSQADALSVELPATAAADPDAWRLTPISELHLENIKGLGAKKIEQITDRCPTIGQLEDLRAGFDGLKALDGIGQAKADAIEEAILNWLSKNRDKEVLAAARGEAAEAVEEIADEEPAAADQSSASTEAVEEGAAESTSADAEREANWHAAIEARSQQIFFRTGDLSSVSPDDCLSQNLEDPRYFESGWEAYNAGNDLVDCGYVPGVERDDWLRGWMSAKLTNEEGWQGPGSEG